MRGVFDVRGVLVLATALTPAVSLAGGFSLNEQSASAMGTANAGAAANPENATTVYFNPAGMTELEGNHVSFGAAVLDITGDFRGQATNNAGQSVNGDDGGDFVPVAVLPNAYATSQVSKNVSVGIGLHAPYGLAADYDDRFKGRYFADETELRVISLSPSIAVTDNNGFSAGIGANLMYAEGTLTKFQDYSAQAPTLAALPGGQQFLNQSNGQGYVDIEGDDLALTFTAGMLYTFNDNATTVGLSARTGTELELEGDATLSPYPDTSSALTGGAVQSATLSEQVVVPLEVPESLTFGLRHSLTDTVTLLAGGTWAKWSRFEALDVISREENGAISAIGDAKYDPKNSRSEDYVGHVSENWQDTWSYSIGAEWKATSAWTLKAGYKRDETPVNPNYITARVPSSDRDWLTLGTQYADESSGWTVDVAAGILLLDQVTIDEREYTVNDEPLPNNANLQGTYELDAWTAAVQVSKSF
ncbi:long-chain fatty acid transport protein [Tamilnaduibacter salinus]|uniref:Aromatic hydrocarbon degradation protein n=1 Tax=Tamilnaduibacter salinus TaxID=1484056 RepID=A0A2A2I153_9GAMM|nr:outer membrane protein transport protein [Tamilnaduibacter salinus]PAV25459.1 aromatic hydrocarbon degradation protein [Tamilnaduibacter salinus]PVY76974.1 long-chain fatty acid transport protein [Tamilnaduibacter salinus]